MPSRGRSWRPGGFGRVWAASLALALSLPASADSATSLGWLRAQMTPNTLVPTPDPQRRGLVLSYAPGRKTPGPLHRRASTYDQALAAIAFVTTGDHASASRALAALARVQRKDGGFWFSYNVENTWPEDADHEMAIVRSGATAWAGYAFAFYLETRPTAEDARAQRERASFLEAARRTADFPEEEFGVKSTFFINTKTFTDDADIGYYDASRIPFLATVRKMGFEIGSHSVSHSKRFASFPFGEPISAGSYRPAQTPTVVGEVKVSKELLDRDLPHQQTLSFRAGELAFPPRLIEALALSGYRYDSTSSANNIITNFPFFALERREVGARETKIVEVPVTVDDALGFLTAARKDEVVRIWTDIIESNRANAAMTCILIHPTDTTYKLEVERQILQRYRRQPVWVGPVVGLGEFWSRRAAASFRLERKGATLVARTDQPASALRDLALVVGPGGPTQLLDRAGKPVPHRQVTVQGQTLLVIQGASNPGGAR